MGCEKLSKLYTQVVVVVGCVEKRNTLILFDYLCWLLFVIVEEIKLGENIDFYNDINSYRMRLLFCLHHVKLY